MSEEKEESCNDRIYREHQDLARTLEGVLSTFAFGKMTKDQSAVANRAYALLDRVRS